MRKSQQPEPIDLLEPVKMDGSPSLKVRCSAVRTDLRLFLQPLPALEMELGGWWLIWKWNMKSEPMARVERALYLETESSETNSFVAL